MSSSIDTEGRPWAKFSAVQEGSLLEADGGFTCIAEGRLCLVRKDKDGELFVPCCGPFEPEELPAAGQYLDRHYLSGQIGGPKRAEYLVGFYLKEKM